MEYAAQTRPGNRTLREVQPILLIGFVSGTLYLVVYLAQRALFRNGLLISSAGEPTRGDIVDRVRLLGQCAVYYGAAVILFILYIQLLSLCYRGRLHDGWGRTLALLFALLFNLGLLLGRPYLSIDVFTYIAYGDVGANLGGNPYVQPVSSVEQTPLGVQLIASGWRPSRVVPVATYGPLWVRCESAVLRLTHDVPTAILLLKGLVVAASLSSAALIWAILGRVRPADQLLGTLMYLWNPVVIVEFAAEGHNDAVMILCVLAALLLAVGARPALAIAALLLGVLAKYVPLILIPAQLAYFWFSWRTRQERARLMPLLLLGALAGLGMAALLYYPLWAGTATFSGLRELGAPHGTASTAGVLYLILAHSPLRAVAGPLTSCLVDGIFGVFVLFTSWRVRDGNGLLKACAGIALVYVLVALPVYWPWYSTLPLALLALSPHGTFRWIALVLSCGARFVAPLEIMRNLIPQPMKFVVSIMLVVVLPLLTFLWLSIHEWHGQSGLTHKSEGGSN